MLKINWKMHNRNKVELYFDDLELNQPFKNASPMSKGAVYIKVETRSGDEFMYEISTGILWPPTESPVEKVDIELNVPLEKPAIYK